MFHVKHLVNTYPAGQRRRGQTPRWRPSAAWRWCRNGMATTAQPPCN